MSQFFNSIQQVASNYRLYDEWEQKQADIDARKDYLSKNSDIPKKDVELTKKKAETVIRATEIMDAKSEDNCENMEQLTGIYSMIPAIGLAVAQVPTTAYMTQKSNEKYNKKINQLKQEIYELKDKKVWEEKHNELTKLYEKKKKNFNRTNFLCTGIFTGLVMVSAIFMILWGNSKQKEASRIGRFQAKQNELRNVENFVLYTPEQIQEAEEIAQYIPDKKEKKSIGKMVSELKEMNRNKEDYREWKRLKDPDELDKLKQADISPEAMEKAKADKELIVGTVKKINIKAEEYSENVENAYDTLSALSWIFAVPLGMGMNKILKTLNVNPALRSAASIVLPFIVSFGITLKGTLEQKKASRVGRYIARQDLLKNPAMLMPYSEEQMTSAENINAEKQKQSFFKKIGKNFAFIKTYSKDKKNYKNYKEFQLNHNEKLQEAFKHVIITDNQRQEAEALQKKVFRAFDEVDEMSQRYSEDVEAGCEVAKQLGSTAWSVLVIVVSAVFARSVRKGNFPIAKIVNKITNLAFSPKSSIRKAINNIYNILSKKDKSVLQEFQKSFSKDKFKKFIKKPENKDVADAINALKEEINKLSKEGIEEPLKNGGQEAEMKNAINRFMDKHLKQSKIAKWTRNMTAQTAKLFTKSKAEKAGVELTPDMKHLLGLDFSYKNYKTLINTGLAAGAPIIGLMFGIPYAFNAWLTNIQKKAGKIGVMKAAETLDDPRLFADS